MASTQYKIDFSDFELPALASFDLSGLSSGTATSTLYDGQPETAKEQHCEDESLIMTTAEPVSFLKHTSSATSALTPDVLPHVPQSKPSYESFVQDVAEVRNTKYGQLFQPQARNALNEPAEPQSIQGNARGTTSLVNNASLSQHDTQRLQAEQQSFHTHPPKPTIVVVSDSSVETQTQHMDKPTYTVQNGRGHLKIDTGAQSSTLHSLSGSSRSRSGSSTMITTELLCVVCQTHGHGRFRCNVCDEVFCESCWDTERPHRAGRLRSGEVPHEKTEEHLYRKVKGCLDPRWTDSEREQAHEDDIDTTWFGVVPDEPLPVFRDYGRFADIVASARDFNIGRSPVLQSLNSSSSTLHPTLTSFVGDTGAGKSTLIKLLIDLRPEDFEQMPTPVVGDAVSTNPTSEDVHLYLDPQSLNPLSLDTHSPNDIIRFFADCEGLQGGERDPLGAKIKFRKQKRAQEAREQAGKEKRKQYISERDLVWAEDASKKKREFIVGHLYPRVLYTFSDVIVFVHRNPRTIESVFNKLLDWAAAAIELSSNQPVLPHAIIVLNAVDHRKAEENWDPTIATRKLMDSLKDVVRNPMFKQYSDFWRHRRMPIEDFGQLLEAYYASITVVYIPTGDRPNLLRNQVQKLHDIIKTASEQALQMKTERRMLLDTDEFEAHLSSAFDQFACNLDKPFDFVQASLTHSPIPNNFAGNIVKLARHIMTRWLELPGHVIFEQLSYMTASCIMLDAVRNKIKGTAEIFFPQYLDHIDEALENFCEQHWPCEIIVGNDRCVNVRIGHTKGHQAKTGKIIAPGEWQSQFTYEGYRELFRHQIYCKLEELRQLVQGYQQEFSWTETQAAAEVHKTKVLAKFFENVTDSNPRSLTSHSVCYCCLFEAPEHPLPCGHIICTPCLRLYGGSFAARRSYSITECPMEKNGMFPDPWKITLRPVNSGVRILTLDGGGIRGIVELEILKQIEDILGSPLQIKHFFDLIVGTSAGGLIALGLTTRNWTVTECIERFRELSKQAFIPRKYAGIKFIGKAVEQFYHSKYMTKPLEASLKKAFTEDTRLFGGCIEGATSTDIKVAITSTSGLGHATLFTNYNRVCTEKLPYHFQRPEDLDDELRLWEVARATSAAPIYFTPFHHSQTKQVYIDGGIYHNNPIYIADREWKVIWPQLQAEHPDIILSVGSAYGPKKNKTQDEKYVSRGIVSHGQFILKLASARFHKALESENVWNDFMSVRPPDAANVGRYQRFNLRMQEAPPKLDQVGSLESLQKFARQEIMSHPRLAPLARRLIATCFYFDPDVTVSRSDDEDIEVTGDIRCRFSNRGYDHAGDEVRAVGRFLQRNRDTSSDFEPCFNVRLQGLDSKLVQSIKITSSTLDHMGGGSFRIERCKIRSGHSTVITSISLCYRPNEEYPLSGFPRKLHEERTGALERRQVLKPSNSTRWPARSPSQRRQRQEWRPSPRLQRSQTIGRIAKYGDADNVFKNAYLQQTALSDSSTTTLEHRQCYTTASSIHSVMSELADDYSYPYMVCEKRGVPQTPVAEMPVVGASARSPPLYELEDNSRWSLGHNRSTEAAGHFFARAVQTYSTGSVGQRLDLVQDDVIQITNSTRQDLWFGYQPRTNRYGWAATYMLQRMGDSQRPQTYELIGSAFRAELE